MNSIKLAIALSVALTMLPPPARAQVQAQPAIDAKIKEIMLNEVKLANFNLRYRLEAAKQGRWKGLRYFFFQETNNGLTEAGLIVGVAERMGHIEHQQFKKLRAHRLEAGNILGGVGQTIAASGSILEFAINGYHSYDAAKSGFSPGQSIKTAAHFVEQIDADLAELHKLQPAESGSGQGRVHELETNVLMDIRDLLVNEFDDFHVKARRTLWRQQSFYLLDVAKNTTGALGSLYGYYALQKHNRLYNRPASVLVTISGAMIMVNPILSRVVGRVAAAVDKKI